MQTAPHKAEQCVKGLRSLFWYLPLIHACLSQSTQLEKERHSANNELTKIQFIVPNTFDEHVYVENVCSSHYKILLAGLKIGSPKKYNFSIISGTQGIMLLCSNESERGVVLSSPIKELICAIFILYTVQYTS